MDVTVGDMRAKGDVPSFRVLSLDGGGIRGLIQARILEEIETRTGRPISDLFDLIAGTSTGGILALGLSRPDPDNPGRPAFRAADLVGFYRDHGQEIFEGKVFARLRSLFDEKYSAEPIEGLLKRYFGDTRLSQSLTSVLVPAYDIEQRRTLFMKHRRNYPGGADDRDFYMRDAARATSAAPTYFAPVAVHALPTDHPDRRKPERFALIDGGVFAANPATSALVEAMKMKQEGAAIEMVSLGTGQSGHGFNLEDVQGWGQLGWVNPANNVPILSVMMDGQSRASEHHMQLLLGARYHRIEAALDGPNPAMDDASPENIARLDDFATRLIAERSGEIDRICAMLTDAPLPAPAAVDLAAPLRSEASRRHRAASRNYG